MAGSRIPAAAVRLKPGVDRKETPWPLPEPQPASLEMLSSRPRVAREAMRLVPP